MFAAPRSAFSKSLSRTPTSSSPSPLVPHLSGAPPRLRPQAHRVCPVRHTPCHAAFFLTRRSSCMPSSQQRTTRTVGGTLLSSSPVSMSRRPRSGLSALAEEGGLEEGLHMEVVEVIRIDRRNEPSHRVHPFSLFFCLSAGFRK